MRHALITTIVVGLLLVLAVIRGVDLWSSYTDTLARGRERAANDALILAEYVAGAFAAGDAALRQLVLHGQRIGGPSAPATEWAPSLASARAGLRGIGAISVVDADLVIRHATRRDIVGQSRRGDAFIAGALTQGGAGLIVGQPFKSPVADGYLLPLGRALVDAEGDVVGAVVASFLPQDLRRFFKNIQLGTHGVVWVFHEGGSVVFREPSDANPIGSSAAQNAIFRAAGTGATRGLHDGAATPGGPAMLSAFHRVGDQPLIVAVSLDRAEVLQPWRREVRGFAITYGLVSLVLIVVMRQFYRQADAKAAAERELLRTRAEEEERLREANDRLAELLEREQEARREAEEASALKDQFVMTVSHELRTPLTAIAGWSRMLVDGMVSDDQRDAALQSIERNAQAQRRLVEDLLDVAGAMNGKLRLDIRDTPIADVVHGAVETIKPAADAKGIRLTTALERELGVIAGDPERLQQVVWNLLSNAVKFTPAGGDVRLRATRDGSTLHISVEDTGAGIPADLLPHVFERFRQGTGNGARRHAGLGLGLAIVRNIVELHGGTVTAASDGPGHGARFDVRLPARG